MRTSLLTTIWGSFEMSTRSWQPQFTTSRERTTNLWRKTRTWKLWYTQSTRLREPRVELCLSRRGLKEGIECSTFCRTLHLRIQRLREPSSQRLAINQRLIYSRRDTMGRIKLKTIEALWETIVARSSIWLTIRWSKSRLVATPKSAQTELLTWSLRSNQIPISTNTEEVSSSTQISHSQI